MNVSWEKLTPADARGFLTAYTVTYDTLEKGQALVEEVRQEESYKVIGNLEVTSSYVVTVAANTIEGRGVDSEEIVVDRKYKMLLLLCGHVCQYIPTKCNKT